MSAVRADFLCVIDLLVAVDCFFQIKIAPVSGAFQIPVQKEPVQFFHVAVQCGNTVFPAEPYPQGNAGRFEGGIDQVVFLLAGYVSVPMFWAEREFDLPADVLAEKFFRLVSEPLLPGTESHKKTPHK